MKVDREGRAVPAPPPEHELLTRLRSLLETFGEHLSECARPDRAKDEGCTCGFRLNLQAVRDLVPYSYEGRAVPAPQEGPPGVAAYEGLLRAVDRGASAPPAPPGPWTYQPDEHGESRWGWYFVKDGAPPRELWFDRGELSEDECIGIRDALNRVADGASAPVPTGESGAASARLDSEPKV